MDEKFREELAYQVEKAFSDTAYPGDSNIITYPDLSLTSELGRDFKGKHWKDISVELVIRERLSLPHFTPAGFRFYLPAFLRAALLYPDQVDILPGNIIYMLTPPDGDEVEKSHFFERISGFTEEQIETIKAFIKMYISIETSYPDPDREKASKFWGQK